MSFAGRRNDMVAKTGKRKRKKNKLDELSRQYFSDNAVFADAFNIYTYHGRQAIDPDSLSELDPAELFLPVDGMVDVDGQDRRRDVLKLLNCREGKKAKFAILGIEEQSSEDCGMAARGMLYDAIRYN